MILLHSETDRDDQRRNDLNSTAYLTGYDIS